MSRLEIMKQNKKTYARFKAEVIPELNKFERLVAENVTLAWIEGKNWMGGLPDYKADRLFGRLAKKGYTYEELYAEFDRQMSVVDSLVE